MLKFITLLIACVALSMCATTKSYTLDEMPDERLEFSFGGGFTGEYSDYMLFPNGQLYMRKRVVRNTTFREYQPINAKVTKDIFQTFDKQDFGALNYNDPGNMTYTIQHIAGADTSQVTWGGVEVKPTEELKTYWRRLMNEVSNKQALVEAQ